MSTILYDYNSLTNRCGFRLGLLVRFRFTASTLLLIENILESITPLEHVLFTVGFVCRLDGFVAEEFLCQFCIFGVELTTQPSSATVWFQILTVDRYVGIFTESLHQ